VSESLVTEVDELKIIYKEIIDGRTPFEDKQVFVKHLTDLENAELTKKRQSLFVKFKRDGLPTEAERLDFLKENELWTLQDEDDLQSYQLQITDNERNISKVIVIQQPRIREIIKDLKEKHRNLKNKKYSLIGATANEYAEKHSLQFFLYLSLYKDDRCKERLFTTPEDVEDLEDDELNPHIETLEASMKHINEEKIKRIAVLPFFLNPFSYCKDSVYHFLCKPLCELTSNQLLLFSMGGRNLNVVSQSSGEPPELVGETKLDDVVNWYDQQYSILLGKRKSGK
jgi:hypothetical protein